jgi:membrane protein YdbS with pleckstrin-like domain
MIGRDFCRILESNIFFQKTIKYGVICNVKQNAFTIIDLIVVVFVIVAVITGFVFPSLLRHRVNRQDEQPVLDTRIIFRGSQYFLL